MWSKSGCGGANDDRLAREKNRPHKENTNTGHSRQLLRQYHSHNRLFFND